jgi:hypothetical protein
MVTLSAAAAGCSENDDVDTLIPGKAAGDGDHLETAEQHRMADAFADCLRTDGINAATELNSQDAAKQLDVRVDGHSMWAWAIDGSYGGASGPEEDTPEDNQAFWMRVAETVGLADGEDVFKSNYLVVNWEDRTNLLDACRKETGFTPPEFTWDPTIELADKAKIAAASVEWATCARSNGFPDLADPPPPVADQWQTEPRVALPETVTPAQLRSLLAVCPSFNAADRDEAERQIDQAADDLSFEGQLALIPADPAITVAGPCDPTSNLDQCAGDARQLHDELTAIIGEAKLEYFASHKSSAPRR